MRVCISIAEHEVEMANRWLDWVCELGGTDGHSLHLIPVSGLDISALLSKAQLAFRGHVHAQKDEEKETSDWQAKDLIRSAAGPNSAFRQVAWDTYMNKRGPYFWCELDCIPLRKDWLDRLEAEYATCGKPFMGAKVEIENVPLHLSGNAIYPWNVPEVGTTLVMRATWKPSGQERRFELAFDVAGAKDTIPNAHFTPLIQHIFRHKGFESRKEFDATIDPNAVVFHSCKNGSIFPYLREKIFGIPVVEQKQEVVEVETTVENVPCGTEKYQRGPDGINDGACSVEGCEKPAHSRGVCRMHYARFGNHGSYDLPPKPTLDQRLSFSREISETGCWLWTDGKNKAGYGEIYIDSRIPKMVHRVSYEHFIGPIPEGLYVCHKCDIPACFNPEHLFPGTNSDNQLDASRKGRLKGRKHSKAKRGKATGELLEKLRANMAKARSIRAAKRHTESVSSGAVVTKTFVNGIEQS